MRYVWIISAIAALSLATSLASAQEVDQNTRQQLEKLLATNVENWNKQDAAGGLLVFTRKTVCWSSLM
jgi:hypothetical protein